MSPTVQTPSPAEVITFYSYKGGTGRTMALVNVACLLARGLKAGNRVLMVDWDLEAPGLHRFLRDRLRRQLGPPPGSDTLLDERPGLLDLFCALRDASRDFPAGLEEPTDEMEEALREAVRPEDFIPKGEGEPAGLLTDFIIETDVPSLHLMKAGRFDAGYPKRVSDFSWVKLYERAAWLFPMFSDWLLKENYQYVLIDSRTGETDTSGICTKLLPVKLVTVFTPNRQSLLGALKVAERATSYRRGADYLPLMVYPLPSRIDPDEPTRRSSWRYGDERLDVPGYEPLFEGLFKRVWDLKKCSLKGYFEEVQIQHTSPYAYGEEIAVLAEGPGDRLSLSRSYEVFAQRLAASAAPWEELRPSESQEGVEKLASLAEFIFNGLRPLEKNQAKQVLTRMVSPSSTSDGDARQSVELDEQPPLARAVLKKFAEHQLVALSRDDATVGEVATFTSEVIIRNWERLRSWVDEDREFLRWRQTLRAAMYVWEAGGHKPDALLSGLALSKARQLANMKVDLSSREQMFIEESAEIDSLRQLSERKRYLRKRRRAMMAIGLLVLGLTAFGVSLLTRPRETLITVGYWPQPYAQEWVDEFDRTNDGSPSRNWRYKPGAWRIRPDEGGEPQSGSLSVEGSGWGLPRNLDGKYFYNFIAEFNVRMAGSAKASWVFRAQPDSEVNESQNQNSDDLEKERKSQSGYVFELERIGNEVYLSGYVVRAGERTPLDSIGAGLRGLPVPFRACCKETDRFRVNARVIDHRFYYTVTREPPDVPPEGEEETDEDVGMEYQVGPFVDKASSFHYGSAGLIGTGSRVLVEYWRVYPCDGSGETLCFQNTN
jgi:hypothetical protein